MKSNILRIISLPLVTIIVILLFLRLNSNYSERHELVNKGYIAETAVNLSTDTEVATLTKVLLDNNYITDADDAQFAAKHIVEKLQSGEKLQSLGDLDKRAWQVPACVIDSLGSPLYRERLALSRNKLEYDSVYNVKVNENLGNVVKLSDVYQGRIVVKVNCEKKNANRLQKELRMNMMPCTHDSIVVRLARIYVDSLQEVRSENIAYAKLDNKGQAVFEGLDTEQLYSVLPIRSGYEYGSSKGTIGGSLSSQGKKELVCNFTEKEHRIRVFDATTMKQIKQDRTITVRTPDEFRSLLVQDVVILMLMWWVLAIYFNKRQRYFHAPLITILLFITGMSLLMMFSINDPLTDRLYGADMAWGIYLGIALMAVFLHIDFTKFYRDQYRINFDIPLTFVQWLFKPYKQKVSKHASILVSKASGLKKTGALLVVIFCLLLLPLDIFHYVGKKLSSTKLGQNINQVFASLNSSCQIHEIPLVSICLKLNLIIPVYWSSLSTWLNFSRSLSDSEFATRVNLRSSAIKN